VLALEMFIISAKTSVQKEEKTELYLHIYIYIYIYVFVGIKKEKKKKKWLEKKCGCLKERKFKLCDGCL
jgi:hypothetical protein